MKLFTHMKKIFFFPVILCICLSLSACNSSELTPSNIIKYGYQKNINDFFEHFSISSEDYNPSVQDGEPVTLLNDKVILLGQESNLILYAKDDIITAFSFINIIFDENKSEDGYNYLLKLFSWAEKTYGDPVTAGVTIMHDEKFKKLYPDYDSFKSTFLNNNGGWDWEYFSVLGKFDENDQPNEEDLLSSIGFLTDGNHIRITIKYFIYGSAYKSDYTTN